MAELGMAQPKSNYFVCRVMQSGMLLIAQYGNARSHTSALPHGRARKRASLHLCNTDVPPQFRLRSCGFKLA